MTIIGITGPSGAGKTSALRAAEKLGALVIDCDKLYHELLERGGDMMSELSARFPGAICSGALDRRALGAIVFSDKAALEDLSAITHKYVIAEANSIISGFAAKGGTLAAIDAIALLESGMGEMCDYTIGVLAPADTRIKRITERDSISRELAETRVLAQKGDEFYIRGCDYIITNDFNTPEEFERHCEEALKGILGGKGHE